MAGSWSTVSVLMTLPIFGRLCLAIVWLRRRKDEQCFILKLLNKYAMWIMTMLAVVCSLSLAYPGHNFALVWLCICDLGLILMVPLGVLGIEGTARLPLGLCLSQLIFGRGSKALAACGSHDSLCKSSSLQSSSDSES